MHSKKRRIMDWILRLVLHSEALQVFKEADLRNKQCTLHVRTFSPSRRAASSGSFRQCNMLETWRVPSQIWRLAT